MNSNLASNLTITITQINLNKNTKQIDITIENDNATTNMPLYLHAAVSSKVRPVMTTQNKRETKNNNRGMINAGEQSSDLR